MALIPEVAELIEVLADIAAQLKPSDKETEKCKPINKTLQKTRSGSRPSKQQSQPKEHNS